MNNPEINQKIRIWLSIVLAVAIILRVILFVAYPAVSYSDTHSYRRSADAVLGGFKAYDGTRTPGYPAFMALVGPDRAVYASQLILGLGITLAWFWIGLKTSGKPWFGGILALGHTLNPGQLFFEANLLTETLATFWLSLALFGACIWFSENAKRSLWLASGIGLSAALATITRPVFIFMIPWFGLMMFISLKDKTISLTWKPAIAVILPGLLLVGGWMNWVRTNYHVFSMTTMTGYHLIQHTGYYFEAVPDEYAEIRDIYLEYRQARMEERGTQGNAIWDAIPAIQAATGLSFYQLSRTLQTISIDLILNHPWAYLSRVLRGWWLFWRAPVYWNRQAVSLPALSSLLNLYILGWRGLLVLFNLGFVASSLVALVSKRLRTVWSLNTFHWLLIGSVWGTSILSSVLDHGDNPRFLVPLQTAVVFLILWILSQSAETWFKNPKARGISGHESA